MFCPVDRNGRPWHTVRCLKCGKVYSVHWTLPVPRLPLCGRHRHVRLSAEERTLELFPESGLGRYQPPEDA